MHALNYYLFVFFFGIGATNVKILLSTLLLGLNCLSAGTYIRASPSSVGIPVVKLGQNPTNVSLNVLQRVHAPLTPFPSHFGFSCYFVVYVSIS